MTPISDPAPKEIIMKKQSGFTLIELLLVLAIIGIISAIAIPALLAQRARARDKTGIANTSSMIADLVSAYDKAVDASVALPNGAALFAACTTTVAPLTQPLSPHFLDEKNPWAGGGGAPALGYAQAIGALATPVDNAACRTLPAAPGLLGQVQIGYVAPVVIAPAMAGGVGGAVYIQNTFQDPLIGATNVAVKYAAID